MSRTSKLRAGLVATLTAAVLAVAAPLASANSLTTTFEGGNGYSGNSFDLEVRSDLGIKVTSIDMHLIGSSLGTKVEVWTRPGTAVGFEDDSDGWTLQDSAVVAVAGVYNPTSTPLSFTLPKGTYGVIIGTPEDENVDYTDGAQTYENGDLKLTSGNGLESPFFDGRAVIEDRIWNGTIHYDVITPDPPKVDPPKVDPPAPCDTSAAEAKLKRKQAKLKSARKGVAKARAFEGSAKTRKKKVAAAKRKVRSAKRGVKAARSALAQAC